MSQNLIDAYTGKYLKNTGIWTGDGKSYEMLPDNTKIWFQPVDSDGNNIKLDGTPGNEIVGPGAIIDQRVFKKDILYLVKHLNISNIELQTRASLIRLTPPEEFQFNKNSSRRSNSDEGLNSIISDKLKPLVEAVNCEQKRLESENLEEKSLLQSFINMAEKNPDTVFPFGKPDDHKNQLDALKKFKDGQMSYAEMRYHCG